MHAGVVTQQFKALLLRKRSDNVLEVSINRAAAKNAFSRVVYFELLRVLLSVREEAQISVIVFTAVGDTFSAGADLKEIAGYEDKIGYKAGQRFILAALVRTFIACPKVLVCLVHGKSVGVSFALNTLCDLVYCTETAQFVAPFTQIGLCAEAGSSYTLPRIMGRIKAAEVLLFGKSLDASEALACNFVARIFQHATLESEFWPFIVEKAKLPANSLQITKRLLRGLEREAILSQLKAEMSELQHLNVSDYHFQQIKKFQERKSKL